jgi:PAS domain S-box-containing protein
MHALSASIYLGMAACVLLGAIYLRIWFSSRSRTALLYFSISAFCVAAYAAVELQMMHADTADAYLFTLDWGHVVAWASYVSFMLFLRHYLNSTRTWIFWTGVTLRSTALLINFLSPVNINFTAIAGIKKVEFLGETLSVVDGTRNPLMIIGHLGTAWILIYCIDAAFTLWRRGAQSEAGWIGGSAVLFMGGRLLDTVLVMWGLVNIPLTASPFFMGIVLVMGYRLSLTAVRSETLFKQLQEERELAHTTQSVLDVATSAANVGVWVRRANGDEMWVSPTWRRIFEFEDDHAVTFDEFMDRVHPDDRAELQETFHEANASSESYNTEYRIVHPDGEIRWISSRGRMDTLNGGPAKFFGASADVTERKLAEMAASELSGKLIRAQENERSRLARELHDDLSQRLALLSIELDLLNQAAENGTDPRISKLGDDVRLISHDVHRMSHELHPASLERLGLEVALGSFSREFSQAHGIDVSLSCENIPNNIPDATALCLYRIVQEALQNVAKHSGASSCDVALRFSDDNLRVDVLDSGKGFDAAAAGLGSGSIGLIGMRERAMAVNGSLKIDSHEGKGTTVTVIVPCSKNDQGVPP